MEADIVTLRCKLKEVEEERLKAAQYGLQLLESQSELQSQLEKCHNEMMTMTENYEQEKYTLQKEVELKSRMLESLSCECEAIKQQQKMHLEKLEEQLNRSHGQEVYELKNKIEKLKVELDEARLNEKQLKHQVDHQKELLSCKSEELRIMSERVHESMSSEMLALQVELAEMESMKTTLKEEVNELQYRQEQLELLITNLMRQVDRLKEEKEEREKEAVSYYNALEKTRLANQDLQVQLDQALQQALDPSCKGNSLFAEVEDRRAAMERQLISMKIKYQSLKNQNAFNREQTQRMKLQIATLLQMKGSQTEFEQQERLLAMLEQKNGEIKHLLGEIRNLEKFKNLYESMESKPLVNSGVLEDNTYYTDLLQIKLDNLKKNKTPQVPVLKKRREVLPVDVATRKDVCADSAIGEEVYRLLPQKEETQSCSNNLEDNNLQLEKSVSVNTPVVTRSPHKNLSMDILPKKEKKSVKLIGVPSDSEALSERSGNTLNSSRLAAESRLQTEIKEGKETASKLEKETCKKSHPILYVSSKSTPETQCPQQ
ncbi:PREDICTED: protein Spindly [Galeopterus variegatus]|uniref:Protein Spindly n=1 Tax=Galeopterus variegatus TaxID=482537 RepID=A0ABM0RW64_GALVR|nr:PREDICTED: protein Spindly [Galeopterus variegatus]